MKKKNAVRKRNENQSPPISNVIDFIEVFENFPAGFFITGAAGNILYSNPSHAGFSNSDKQLIEMALSQSDENVLQDDFERKLPPEGSPVNIALKENRTVTNMRVGFKRAAKETLWLSVSACPLKNNGSGASVTYFDITDLKRAQEELEESRQRYKQMLSNFPDTLIVFKSGKILFSNERIRKFLGYRPFELTGDSLSKIVSKKFTEIFSEKRWECARNAEVEMTAADGTAKFARADVFKINFNGMDAKMAVIKDLAREKKLEKEVASARKQLIQSNSFSNLIGKSEKIREIFDIIPGISSIGCNVLLEGESGTGKSAIACLIHDHSASRRGKFVGFNCAAIPETLFESELFGHVKGAFTDAKTDKTGKFAAAEGGTIFIDEIGELPLGLQVKLLKVIEEKKYEPVGSAVSVALNARIIAASNRNLREMVKTGRFREDLYYRLNVVSLVIPPLRDRKDDIRLLADNFISVFNELYSKNILGMSDDYYKFLYNFAFPGNIRELRNIIERSCIFCARGFLDIADLAPEYREFSNIKSETASQSGGRETSKDVTAVDTGHLNGHAPRQDRKDGLTPFERSEKEKLVEILEKFKNDKNKVYEHLMISRMTLWRKMKKYGLL